MIKVILAEDHHLVRQGIRSLLERVNDIEILAEAENGEEAFQLVRDLHPDVLVTDIGMPRLNGIQAAEKIRDHGLTTRVVILSMHSDKSLVQQCMRLGVKGYVLKNSVRDELVMAIQAAARNATYLSPAVSDLVLNTLTGSETEEVPDGYDQLTAREREILKLIAEGYTNKAIADTLHLSIKTIEKDRSRLIDKLKTRDLAGLIRIAMKHGLVLPGEKPPSI